MRDVSPTSQTLRHLNKMYTLQGLDTGLSQTSRKNSLESSDEVVWNFPVDVTFKSTNVYGWPRIAIAVYGADYLGRDVVRGYCSCLMPLSSGSHTLSCDMYTPLATSTYNQAMSWLLGNPPEFLVHAVPNSSAAKSRRRLAPIGALVEFTVWTWFFQRLR